MKNSDYAHTNKGNEQSGLSKGSEDGTGTNNGFIRFATAYGTPDGIVVEVYSNKHRRYFHPYKGWQEKSSERLSTPDEIEERDWKADMPPTLKMWGDLVPVRKVKITPASGLKGREHAVWVEDVEGIYRDDPFEGSHVHEHYASTMNRNE